MNLNPRDLLEGAEYNVSMPGNVVPAHTYVSSIDNDTYSIHRWQRGPHTHTRTLVVLLMIHMIFIDGNVVRTHTRTLILLIIIHTIFIDGNVVRTHVRQYYS